MAWHGGSHIHAGIERQKITGVAGLLESIRQETAQHPEKYEDPTPATDTEHQKYLDREAERKKKRADQAKADENWNPKEDVHAEGDPYKTLFISRLSKDATEEDLRREFAMYGHIEKLRIVRDCKTGKSKGYAFILYEREKDMKGAFLITMLLVFFLLKKTLSGGFAQLPTRMLRASRSSASASSSMSSVGAL